MNERIRGLALQAGIKEGKSFMYSTYEELVGHSLSKQALAKFAALIVQECVQVVNDCEKYGCGKPLEFEVLEHFGIEQ